MKSESKQWDSLSVEGRWRRINATIDKATIRAAQIKIALVDGETVCVPVSLKLRANGKTIVNSDEDERTARTDRALIRAVVRANHWWELFESGEARTPHDIARLEKCRVSYVQRHLPLAFLSPKLIEDLIYGQQPDWCVLSKLVDWSC